MRRYLAEQLKSDNRRLGGPDEQSVFQPSTDPGVGNAVLDWEEVGIEDFLTYAMGYREPAEAIGEQRKDSIESADLQIMGAPACEAIVIAALDAEAISNASYYGGLPRLPTYGQSSPPSVVPQEWHALS
jgi:hypothetical protein